MPEPVDLADESITLSEDVHVDFTPGHDGVLWATLHAGACTVEVGSIRRPGHFNEVMSVVAAWLLEHPSMADEVKDKWVLVGRWILDGRAGGTLPFEHRCFADPRAARIRFRQECRQGAR
jgi:hypothetical protein